MIAKSIRVVALGVLLAVAVAGSAQAGAPCGKLLVSVKESKTPMQLDPRSVKCKHGKFGPGSKDGVLLLQSLSYGPNCTMTAREIGGQRYQTFRVQQNFCGLKAGKITVQMQYGAAIKFTKTEGSYAKRKGGKVSITDFK